VEYLQALQGCRCNLERRRTWLWRTVRVFRTKSDCEQKAAFDSSGFEHRSHVVFSTARLQNSIWNVSGSTPSLQLKYSVTCHTVLVTVLDKATRQLVVSRSFRNSKNPKEHSALGARPKFFFGRGGGGGET
jgi:hypothetical protein